MIWPSFIILMLRIVGTSALWLLNAEVKFIYIYEWPGNLFLKGYSKNFFYPFIWRSKLNNWTFWNIFMQFHSLIPCSLLPLFPGLIVAKFLPGGYLDKKLICFVTLISQVKTLGKTYSILLVTIVNLSSSFLKINVPKHWSWGVIFTAGIKDSWENYIMHDLLFAYFNSYYFIQIEKISCGPDLPMGLIYGPI